MKIYVAGSYSHKRPARVVARALEAAGHTITSFWHEQPDDVSNELHEKLALADIEAIREADLVIALEPDLSTTGGTHYEAGIAYLDDKKIAVVANAPSNNLLLRATSTLYNTNARHSDYIRMLANEAL